MPTTIKGQAACPECGSTQPVKHDGRKYFINCADCLTFTTYQSKAAQQRVLSKLTPAATESAPTEIGVAKEKPAAKPKLHKPVRATDSLVNALSELF